MGHTGVLNKTITYSNISPDNVFLFETLHITPRAQLFEGQLGLNPELNLNWVSFSTCMCKGIFSDNFLLFLELPIINLKTKTEMLFKLSNLNSNLALTLCYLNPALNNSAQET